MPSSDLSFVFEIRLTTLPLHVLLFSCVKVERGGLPDGHDMGLLRLVMTVRMNLPRGKSEFLHIVAMRLPGDF